MAPAPAKEISTGSEQILRSPHYRLSCDRNKPSERGDTEKSQNVHGDFVRVAACEGGFSEEPGEAVAKTHRTERCWPEATEA